MRKAIAAFLALMLVASSAALAEPAWMDYDCGLRSRASRISGSR